MSRADPAGGRSAPFVGPTAREEVAQEGVSVAGEDRLRMELHALDRAHVMAEAHDQAVRRVGRDLQALREGLALDDEAVIATDAHRLGESFEEAAPVVVDEGLVAVHGLGTYDASPEVLTDRLVAETDPQDGELRWSQAQALARRTCSCRTSGAGPDQESRRPHGLDRGPIRAVGAHDFDLGAELLEELSEVEGERVAVVEDHDHSAQDAQRGLLRKAQAKKQVWSGSRLAEAHPWNKVPR